MNLMEEGIAYTEGWEKGYEAGTTDERKRIVKLLIEKNQPTQLALNFEYQKGFDEGFEKGYNDGFEDGHNRGFDEGYRLALSDSYWDIKTAYASGRADGWEDGLHDGLREKTEKYD